MTIKEIVEKHLKDGGYTGLVQVGECGCGMNDLMPCDCPCVDECVPGYKTKATQKHIDGGFDGEVGDDIYVTEKP